MMPTILAASIARASTAADLAGEDFMFHLPSSIAINGASSTDDTRSLSADLNYSFRNNVQLSGGYSRSNVTLNGDTFSFNEIRVGAGTDPLETVSASIAISALANGSDTKQNGVALELMWSPEDFIITLTPGAAQITTANRPNVFQEDSSLEIKQTSLELAVEYFIGKGFSLRPFGVTYSYDSDLNYFNKAAQVSQALNVEVIPASSQQLITALPDYIYGLGLNYSRKKWSCGIEASQTKTKFDNEADFALKISGSYRFAKGWNAIASVGQLPSFAGDYANSNRTIRLGMIHTW